MPAGPMPVPVSRLVDPADLVGSFARNAEAVSAVVHRVPGADVPVTLLEAIITAESVASAVFSKAPAAQVVGGRLASLGVRAEPYSPAVAALADLGVTAPVAGLAATGTLVQDSAVDGGRAASLLPRVHLAVIRASTVVASTTEVLRLLGDGRTLPSNLVLITGPSCTGDIEMILTLGVHGPVRVHIVVLDGA